MVYLSFYILIGTLITMIYDIIQSKLVKKDSLIFTNSERLLLIFFWPIILVVAALKHNKNSDE